MCFPSALPHFMKRTMEEVELKATHRATRRYYMLLSDLAGIEEERVDLEGKARGKREEISGLLENNENLRDL